MNATSNKYKFKTKFKVHKVDLHQLFSCNYERITQIINLNVLRLKVNHHEKKRSSDPGNQS